MPHPVALLWSPGRWTLALLRDFFSLSFRCLIR
jgi:hypothetical protein